MRRFFMMALALVIVAVLPACSGSLGQFKTIKAAEAVGSRSVTVDGFSGLEVSGQIEVKVAQGQLSPVTLSGPANLLDYIEVEVKDGVLHLSHKDGLQFDYAKDGAHVVATVSVPDIALLKVYGQSEVAVTTPIEAKSFTLEASGQSELKLPNRVKAVTLTVTVGGQSELDMMGGEADVMTFKVSGQSEAELKGDYVCRELSMSLSGQSDGEIKGNVKATLVDISTSGQSDFESKGSIVADRGVFSASGQSDMKFGTGEIKSISSRSSGQSDINLGKINSQYPTVEE
ncbi:MAG: DUF2807 domain-containing protein [Pseudoflavonifractor sp.]|nr:DUF2807 domain-containing protein [Pseudoflavonifractor sp.]